MMGQIIIGLISNQITNHLLKSDFKSKSQITGQKVISNQNHFQSDFKSQIT